MHLLHPTKAMTMSHQKVAGHYPSCYTRTPGVILSVILSTIATTSNIPSSKSILNPFNYCTVGWICMFCVKDPQKCFAQKTQKKVLPRCFHCGDLTSCNYSMPNPSEDHTSSRLKSIIARVRYSKMTKLPITSNLCINRILATMVLLMKLKCTAPLQQLGRSSDP